MHLARETFSAPLIEEAIDLSNLRLLRGNCVVFDNLALGTQSGATGE